MMTTKKERRLILPYQLKKVLRIRTKKEKHLISVLAHASSFGSHQMQGSVAYERLEFFGDAVLNFVICEKLFQRFPYADEGALSRLRSTLVSKKVLLRIAKSFGLNQLLTVGKRGRKENFLNSKLLSDVLEALIGAIYLDRGLKAAQQLIWKNWNPYFDEKKLRRLDPNPKSTLQEIAQKIFRTLPVYETKPRKKGFSASVRLPKRLVGKGIGSSKQGAEEEAALNLIRKLKLKKTYSRFWKSASKSVIPVVTAS